MALIGPLDQIMSQSVDYPGFKEAYEYLALISQKGSKEHQRLSSHGVHTCVKILLNESIFALEQVYFSKDRHECFFESHRGYIDIQFILDGEERIEHCSTGLLTVDIPYDVEKDLTKYCDRNNMSSLLLQKGDVAIFFPDDAHMPCLKTDISRLVYKTVIKVPVRR